MDEEYARHNHQSEYDFGKLILEEHAARMVYSSQAKDHPWYAEARREWRWLGPLPLPRAFA